MGMEDNLVGYLLNALDPDVHRETEDYLRSHPEAQKRLETLRRALEPLEADRDGMEPPPGLWVRTLACLAEHRCRELPQAPAVTPFHRAPAHGRRWWLRSDALVAAGIFLCVGLLIPPGLNHLRQQQQVAACSNNLREIGQALVRYSDLERVPGDAQHRRGCFPNVARLPAPRNVAGAFIPTLIDAKVLNPEQVSVVCPGQGDPVRPRYTLSDLLNMPADEVERRAPELSPSYAYSLGYQNGHGNIHNHRDHPSPRPVVADAPPFGRTGPYKSDAHSPNHAGRGQNVLFSDGHVRFLKARHWSGDDIYLNAKGQPAVGMHASDHVLGASDVPVHPVVPDRD